MLRAELHTHVKIFINRKFSPEQLKKRLNWAKRIGLNVLAITEHLDLPDFWEIYDCLEELCSNGSGALQWEGTTVLAGTEVSIEEGGHILLIGSLETLKILEGRLGRVTLENAPDFKFLMDNTEDLNFVRIGAHPCRYGYELWKIGSQLKRLDALEINANELIMAKLVQRQAFDMKIPVLAGSDAHHWLQMGRVYNLLPLKRGFTIADLKQVVARYKVTWCRQGAISIMLGGLLKGAVK
ncbi:hypothetical protein SAMN05660649_00710 [Desulfotomaculum arcticum]|uniref:PHP domain-containing protein n=1 Tax=Desulfotruncus arcticus DSM 17038 TaxID=1121424 RepID=A0A1I2PAM8_9FIRM|nr:hypothetical protein SAMN05660649_00710 [Desulfotomaculum arcticum] [Desulfotruncus arcticus DSM 17038]